MENEFSFLELRIIQSLISKKSFREIAAAIERPVEMVAEYVTKITQDSNRSTRQQVINKKNESRLQKKEQLISNKRRKVSQKNNKEKIERERRQLKKVARIRQQQINEQERKVRRREPEYATRQVDYNKMISVRIDKKTVLQVPAGTDIEALKKKFLKRAQDSKIEATHYKVVKKFK